MLGHDTRSMSRRVGFTDDGDVEDPRPLESCSAGELFQLARASPVLSLHMTSLTLTELSLRGEALSDSDSALLWQYVAMSPVLESLCASRCRLGEASGALIGSALSRNTSVLFADLSMNSLGPAGCAPVAAALAANHTILHLDLSDTDLGGPLPALPGEDAVAANAGTAGATGTTAATRSNTTSSDTQTVQAVPCADASSAAASQPHALSPVSLGASLSSPSPRASPSSRSGSSRSPTSRSGGRPGAASRADTNVAVAALVAALKCNTSLTNLNLYSNRIGPGRAGELFVAIGQHPAMTSVNVGMNLLGSKSAFGLATALDMSRSLTAINASQADLTQGGRNIKGLVRLAASLAEDTLLSRISLRRNVISAVAATAIFEQLVHHPCILDLDMSFNPIGRRGAQAAATLITHGRVLEQLKLNDCWIDSKGAMDIAAAITQNHGLKELDLTSSKVALFTCTLLHTLLLPHTATATHCYCTHTATAHTQQSREIAPRSNFKCCISRTALHPSSAYRGATCRVTAIVLDLRWDAT